jgi:hypothetical protein
VFPLVAALVLTATAAPQRPAAPPRSPVERRRAEIARELIAVGAAIQRGLEAGDAGPLLARVPAGGLRCAGATVPRARVVRDLGDPGAWLHRTYLAPPAPGAPGSPASLRAFFAVAREVAVVVSFRRDPAAAPTGRPCLDYRSPGLRTPGAPLCFETRGGRWWLVESLYPCG